MSGGNEYESKSAPIRQLAALPPDQLSTHLSNVHSRLSDVAPNLVPHVSAAAANAVQFLNSKLPPSGNELPGDQQIPPSDAEQRRWLDLHAMVSNPTSILSKVANGTMDSHHLEAVKSVYPDLHAEMAEKIQEELGNAKNKGQSIPYAKRQAISQFIGQPLDSTMTQPNAAAIIQSAAGNTAPAASAPKKASGVELRQINKVDSMYQTQTQARLANKKA